MKQAEILKMQTGTAETEQQNEELIHVEQIPNTPFSTVTVEEGTFIAIGRYRLTDYFETELDAVNFVHQTNNWYLMMSLMHTIILTQNQINQQ